MRQLLIKCGWLVSMDAAIGDLKNADILVIGDKIVAVGRQLEHSADEVIDARDMIVIPGLVNAHIHLWQTGMKAIGSQWVSSDYHTNMHANIATRYGAEDTYVGNLCGALNQIENGTTTVLDWCHNLRDLEMAERALDGLQDSQIRAVFAHGTAKPPTAEGDVPYTHIPHPRERVEYLRNNRLTGKDGLVTLAMAILGPEFGSFDVAVQDLRLARDLDLLSSAHVWHGYNRNLPSKEQVFDSYGRLAKLGLLGPDHNVVHGNYMADDQVKLIVDQGVSVTSTVMCEIHGHGASPLTGKVRELGVLPSIGTDTTTLVAEDMFGEMRGSLIALRFQISHEARNRGDYPLTRSPVDTREALAWATIGGAKALGLDDRIGSLSPGKKADIVMVRAGDSNLFPVHDPVFAIVENANGSNVEHVLIDGEYRKRDGRIWYPKAEHEKLRSKLMDSAERLMSEASYRPIASKPSA